MECARVCVCCGGFGERLEAVLCLKETVKVIFAVCSRYICTGDLTGALCFRFVLPQLISERSPPLLRSARFHRDAVFFHFPPVFRQSRPLRQDWQGSLPMGGSQ